MAFQKNYLTYRLQIISDQEVLATQEKTTLRESILFLDNSITSKKLQLEDETRLEVEKLKQQLQVLSTPADFIQRCIDYFHKHLIKSKIRGNEINLSRKISHETRHWADTLLEKKTTLSVP
jgi:hypothetical protein